MSMKKSDMAKSLANKLGGKMKAAEIPKRFAQGASEVASKGKQRASNPEAKLVAVACRLPADLVNQLRDRAAGHEGGLNALMAEALGQWLAASKQGPAS